jgi:hypothetical protein
MRPTMSRSPKDDEVSQLTLNKCFHSYAFAHKTFENSESEEEGHSNFMV